MARPSRHRTERPASTSLSAGPDARREAFAILLRVEEAGAFAGILLEKTEPSLRDPRDRALLHELVLGVLRRRSALDHAIAKVASRPIDAIDNAALTALRLGAYALLFLERVPDFAAVSTSVDLVKGSRSAAAGFVNGVLRRVAREGASLLPPMPAPGDVAALSLYHAHPAWWVERLVARFGFARANAILAADNRSAPTVLRARRSVGAVELSRRLADEGVVTEACAMAPYALRVVSGAPQNSAAFRDGWFWIQDEASQLVPMLLGDRPGPRIADLCAAPGGKTLALADTAPDASIIACDRHHGRLRRMQRNLARLAAARVALVAADMASAPPLLGPFDHVLLDAPCSGTGTLRRHPEIRWRLTQDGLASLAVRQARLLDTAAALAAPAAEILYAVCSLEPEEGEGAITGFLQRHSEWERMDPRPRLPERARALVGDDLALRSSPDVEEMDGFFAALLTRSR